MTSFNGATDTHPNTDTTLSITSPPPTLSITSPPPTLSITHPRPHSPYLTPPHFITSPAHTLHNLTHSKPSPTLSITSPPPTSLDIYIACTPPSIAYSLRDLSDGYSPIPADAITYRPRTRSSKELHTLRPTYTRLPITNPKTAPKGPVTRKLQPLF
nr:putative uncharacterized protein ENSP00000383309 [Penaeus vannamei]